MSCPRCGGPLRPPDLMISVWRCDGCGPVPPMHIAGRVGHDVMASVSDRIANGPNPVPMWCPWPLPAGWLVTGVGWAGDGRSGAHATAIACSGPAPLTDGPADIVLVAEEPGVGLGNHLAGLAGTDPGLVRRDGSAEPVVSPAHAKVKAAGRATPMWSVATADDRVAYVGEARGMWLYAIVWPADAGYLLSEPVVLHDLNDWLPAELVYGAPSPHFLGGAGTPR